MLLPQSVGSALVYNFGGIPSLPGRFFTGSRRVQAFFHPVRGSGKHTLPRYGQLQNLVPVAVRGSAPGLLPRPFLLLPCFDVPIGLLRKLLSISLLAVFGLPLFAPLLALGQRAEDNLPACCRRNGTHHCAMSMAAPTEPAASDRKASRWNAPVGQCPYCPASVATGHHRETFAAPPAQAIYAELLRHPAGSVQTESRRRIARDRSRRKRGPPILSLA